MVFQSSYEAMDLAQELKYGPVMEQLMKADFELYSELVFILDPSQHWDLSLRVSLALDLNLDLPKL